MLDNVVLLTDFQDYLRKVIEIGIRKTLLDAVQKEGVNATKEMKEDLYKLEEQIILVQKNQVEFEEYLKRIDKVCKEIYELMNGVNANVKEIKNRK